MWGKSLTIMRGIMLIVMEKYELENKVKKDKKCQKTK